MQTFYIGLYTQLPEANSPGVEVSGAGYARISLGAVDFGGQDIVTNSESLTFPSAQGDWGIVRGFGLFNENGHLLISGPLRSAPVRITDGCSVTFGPHSISISAMFLVSPEELRELLSPPPSKPIAPKRTLWERLTEDD